MADHGKALYESVTHVVFDMDGLLLDTETLYTESIQKVVDAYDRKYTWDVKMKMMGVTTQEGAEIIVRELDLPITPKEYIEQTKAVYAQVFPQAKLLPGVDKLVRHLHKHNIPIAIATSSSKSSFDMKTAHHNEFIKLFNHIVLGSDDPEVKRGKPSPDIFLVCASRFSDKPDYSKVLVFEDAVFGLDAGLSAGMQVVFVPDERVPNEVSVRATQVLTSLEHFKPGDFGLPDYD